MKIYYLEKRKIYALVLFFSKNKLSILTGGAASVFAQAHIESNFCKQKKKLIIR